MTFTQTRLGGLVGLVTALVAACAPGLWRVAEPRPLLTDVRQLTFAGRRAGEGYFSADGRQVVFQSEREPGNPFYQIYRLDLTSGAQNRVSPGHGKTTCAWFHPSGERILFASTHHDPSSRALQEAELELRASGAERRYSWDFDPEFELYTAAPDGSDLLRLTHAAGYDAEASFSPDGEWIVFSSNRAALASEDEATRSRVGNDPSYGIDLYRMRADGSELERLTHAPGYDGGPFFSPDGTRIVWRRFAPDGATAELYSMAADGSDVRVLTRLGALSWAPFYHPSSAYVTFATNRHGFGNFELYIVDAAGRGEPVRVTESSGFDGLPVFTPDGEQLAWTSTRGGAAAQIHMAAWDHTEALRRLGLADVGRGAVPPAPLVPGRRGAIRAADLKRHAERLSADDMDGRATGSPGAARATEYVAHVFAELGLEPAGDGGSFFQRFEFTSGVSLGARNVLRVEYAEGVRELELDRDWRPLAFSEVGESGSAPVVFAGYGIVAPASGELPAYDAYADLDVAGRWVVALRFLPEDLPAPQRQHLNRYAGLRYKAMLARERGALGLIVVVGPNSRAREPLVRLAVDVALAGTSVYALSVAPETAEQLLGGRDLGALQSALDSGEPGVRFQVPGVTLDGVIDLVHEQRVGRNVLGRLRRGRRPEAAPVLIGAHVDHIGRGTGGTSLARDAERGTVHPGADDNASGVAALLEIADWLSADSEPLERDLLFAAWSGEELGLLGSSHWAEALDAPDPHTRNAGREVAAYLNMDMIGRFDEKLTVHGLGSSSVWGAELERANAPIGLSIQVQAESYLPTDATSFYLKGVPILSAFTGAHAEYHTPRDTADRLDYEASERIARLVGSIARSLAADDELPDYIAMARPGSGPARGSIRVYLGTIPNYGRTEVRGVALSGVSPHGPAERAGLRAGDVVVEVAGQSVENIYDYTYALDALRPGEAARVVVERGGERLALSVVPEARE